MTSDGPVHESATSQAANWTRFSLDYFLILKYLFKRTNPYIPHRECENAFACVLDVVTRDLPRGSLVSPIRAYSVREFRLLSARRVDQ